VGGACPAAEPAARSKLSSARRRRSTPRFYAIVGPSGQAAIAL
jgi:hypothetical protein